MSALVQYEYEAIHKSRTGPPLDSQVILLLFFYSPLFFLSSNSAATEHILGIPYRTITRSSSRHWRLTLAAVVASAGTYWVGKGRLPVRRFQSAVAQFSEAFCWPALYLQSIDKSIGTAVQCRAGKPVSLSLRQNLLPLR